MLVASFTPPFYSLFCLLLAQSNGHHNADKRRAESSTATASKPVQLLYAALSVFLALLQLFRRQLCQNRKANKERCARRLAAGERAAQQPDIWGQCHSCNCLAHGQERMYILANMLHYSRYPTRLKRLYKTSGPLKNRLNRTTITTSQAYSEVCFHKAFSHYCWITNACFLQANGRTAISACLSMSTKRPWSKRDTHFSLTGLAHSR